ncbi:MAG: response regulator [Candidatus Omnitrophota bacterium]|nr:response regulator [Candidatus Omnitrophota bacterium]
MGKKRILLVDDEIGFTNMMRLYLEKAGDYEVMIENDSSRALGIVKKFNPDMIFLDVLMPQKDGGEIAKEIRSEPAFKNIPIVFMTAIADSSQSTAKGGTIGGYQFLPKPISGSQVLSCIKENIGI